MNTQQVEYIIARARFEEAENKGLKLLPGRFETSLWLHKERINLDSVIEIARNYPDARTFIISDGPNKGFYIYSSQKKLCFKLLSKTPIYTHAESAWFTIFDQF